MLATLHMFPYKIQVVQEIRPTDTNSDLIMLLTNS